MSTRGRPKDEDARERILDAAAELFERDGYMATTMNEIGERANVAVKTIYAAYGSKIGVLEATHFRAVRGSMSSTPLIEQQWVKDLANAESVQEAWKFVSKDQAESTARVAPILNAISCSSSDPPVRTLLDRLKDNRYYFWDVIAGILLTLPGAGGEHRRTAVADAMFAIMSVEVYTLLIADRGWTDQQWQEWTHDQILFELTKI